MNLRKGKKAALGSAAALLAVLGVAVLLRQEIERAYHLVRLRAERSYLAFIAGAAPESPAGRAVDRYLESRTGKEALFLEYATHLAEEVDYQESPAAVFRRFRGEVMWYDASYAGMPLPTGCVYCENHTVADVVDGLLPRIHGERFTLPGSDGFVYSVITTREAVSLYRTSLPRGSRGSIFTRGPEAAFVLRVRKE